MNKFGKKPIDFGSAKMSTGQNQNGLSSKG
jgi:hypothetical protein